jgi:hypothetical protein
MQFWVPSNHNQGLGISVLTYDGRVRIGITADKTVIPDPRNLLRCFTTEIEAMQKAKNAQ